MARRIVAVALATAWGTFAACSSFDSEAPAVGDEAGSPDAADTGVVADAGAEVEAGRFCESLATKPILCVDFDEGDPVDYGFETKYGTPSVDTTFAKSPPGSLLAPVQMSYLERYFPGDAKAVQLSYAVRGGGADGGPPLTNFVIVSRIAAGTQECSFDLAIAQKQLEIQVQNPDGGEAAHEDLPLLRYPVPGEWTDVTVRLTDDGAGVTAAVDIANGEALAPVMTICPNLGVGTRIDLGLLYAGADNEVRLDNVVFNRE